MARVRALCALGLVLAAGGGQAPTLPSPALLQELQRLQGGWRIEAQQEDGRKVSAEDLNASTVFFGRDTFLLRRSDNLMQIGMLKLDPAKSPKTVDAVILRGPQKGDTMQGIYSLDGDTLKVCFYVPGDERPTDFTAPAGSSRLLMVGKRMKTKDSQPDLTGAYRSESTEIDGTKHVALTTIERMGDAYLVTYRKAQALAYLGIGLRKGNVFCMSWISQGQAGITLYDIEPGPRLVGQYTQLGGPGFLSEEVLTRIENKP